MNQKAALFPTIFAIAMAVASIGIPIPGTISGTPWLMATHSQFINATNQMTNVDTIAFYLWGLEYTVVGKTIQSKIALYDPFGDFPMFSMYMIIIAVIIAIFAIMSNRIPKIPIKGRDIDIKVYSNPMALLVISTMLMIVAAVYLYYSSNATIIPALYDNNYNVRSGIGFQFMGISVVGFLISVVITYINARTEEKEEKEEEDEEVESFQEAVYGY